jgi:hypothetical protein
MTHIIQTQAAQGDVMFRRIEALPTDAQPAKAIDGAFVVAHSETGHNHVVMERPTVKMFSAMDEFRSYLVVEDKPAEVKHQRSFDTHQSFALAPGIWEVRRQREYTPEGFRRAAD